MKKPLMILLSIISLLSFTYADTKYIRINYSNSERKIMHKHQQLDVQYSYIVTNENEFKNIIHVLNNGDIVVYNIEIDTNTITN